MIRSYRRLIVGLLSLGVSLISLSTPVRAAVTDTIAPADITTLTTLSALSGGAGAITLTWTASGDDGTVGVGVPPVGPLRYYVKYATFDLTGITTGQWWTSTSAGLYAQTLAPKTSPQTETLTLAGLTEGTTYYLGVIAEDECNNRSSLVFSTGSNTANVPRVLPTVPALSAVTGDKGGRIALSFTHSGDDGNVGLVTTYYIYRSTAAAAVSSVISTVTSGGGILTPKAAGTADTYTVMGLTPGAAYFFRLEARDDVGQGATSSEVSATARQDDTKPLPVTSIIAKSGGADGDGTITVAWSYSPDQDQSLPAAYIIYYSSIVQFRPLSSDHLNPVVVSSKVALTFPLFNGAAYSVQTASLTVGFRRQNFWVTVVASDTAGLWKDGPANFSDVVQVVSAQPKDATGPDIPTGVTAVVMGNAGPRVELSWAAPQSDTGTVTSPPVARYEIKYATFGAVTPYPTDWWLGNALAGQSQATTGYDRRVVGAAPGATESQVISGLAGAPTAYYFAVRAYDVDGSSGAVSVVSTATLVGNDILPPAGVNNFVGARDAAVKTTINLTWTAPADPNSGVKAYTVRWSTWSIPMFASATDWWYGTTVPAQATIVSTATPGGTPKDPGGSESFLLTGMTTAQAIYAMLRSNDAAGNVSDLSNSSAAVVVPAVADTTLPGPIIDLVVSSVSIAAVSTLYATGSAAPATGQVELTWAAPGDDGAVGKVAAMVVRYATTSAITTEPLWTGATVPTGILASGATAPLNSPSVLAPGSKQSYVVTGLTTGTTYYFAVRGLDAAGNLGALSGGTVTSCLPSQMVSVLFLMDLTANGTPIHSGEYYHIGPMTILGSTTSATGMAADDGGRGIQLNKNGSSWVTGGTASGISRRLIAVSGRVAHANGQLSLEDIRQYEGGITTVNLPAPAWTPTVGMLQNGSANLADVNNPENYESRLVALRGVQKVDAVANVWPTGGGFSIDYLVYDDTGGASVQTTVRFSTGVGMSANVEPGLGVRFDVIGVLGQNDTTDPRYQSYRVFPSSNTVTTKALGVIERPRGLSALAGPTGSGSVTLTWTAVQDPDRNGFLISSGPTQNGPWTVLIDTPSVALTQITVTSGLLVNTSYYFAVQMKQATNTTWSALGSAGNAYLQSGPPMANALTLGATANEVAWVGSSWGADVTAPSSPTAVAAAPSVSTNTEGAIDLTWTAPGNDGVVGTAAKYLIRYATWPTGGLTNTTDWWNGALASPVGARTVETYLNVPAPKAAGSSEALTLSGLVVGATYYIAMRAVDYAGNVSTLSNWVFAPSSNLKPPAPTGLTAVALDKGVVLTWQAPTVPGQFGEAIDLTDVSSGTSVTGAYRIYWNDGRSGMRDTQGSANGTGCYDNVIPASQTAVGITVIGRTRSYPVVGLVNGRNHYFVVSAVDAVGNEGTVSSPEIVATPAQPPQALIAGLKITEAQIDGPGGTKNQFIEIYNASDAPIDISRYSVMTRSLSSSFNANFMKGFIPPGTVLGARQHYVIGFVENTGLYRAGTNLGIIYPLADYDSGDPETLDATNEKPASKWPAGQGPGKSSFGMSMGTNILLLGPGAEANLDKATSGSWKIPPDSLPGNPIVDRITFRGKTSGGTGYNANSDGTWLDGNGRYLDLPNNIPTGIGVQNGTLYGSLELWPNFQTLSIQRVNDDVDTDNLADWRVDRANPGAPPDPIAPAKINGLTVDGRDTTDPNLDNVEGGIKLTFPAVGDDGTLPGNVGRATGYVVNYATWGPMNAADLTAWQGAMFTYLDVTPRTLFVNGANVQTVSWIPASPGTVEKHRIAAAAFAAFKPGTRFWFAVRAVDEVGNDSGIGLDNFSPLFNPLGASPVGWIVFNPYVKTPRVLAPDFGKSALFTRPDKTAKTLVKTPGYLADTGNSDAGTADKITLPANSLDPETVPTCTLTFTKGGAAINLDKILGGVKVDGVTQTGATNTLVVNVRTDVGFVGALPDIQIGDRSTTKVGEEASVPDQVDMTFPALPGLTLTRYNDVYPPSKPGDVENTVKPTVDSGAGTITGPKGTVEPFSTVVFYGQNPAGKTRAELAKIEIKAAPGRAGGAPFSAYASTAADTNGGFPTTVVGNSNSYVYVVVRDAAGNLSPAFAVQLPPTVTEFDALGPNPLLPSKNKVATLWFNLKETTKVKAVVFNADGELVKTLLDGDDAAEFDAGWGRTRVNGQPNPDEMVKNGEQPAAGTVVRTVRAVAWDGMNEAGKRVASGVYLIRFEAGGVKTTKKMLVIQ